MSPDAAADLIDMMRGVVVRGTGTLVKSRFGVTGDVAGKTGTTQNNTDGWFILMHPQLVAGAWVGFNDSRVAMRSAYWGQGGHNAILLVGDFFKAAQKAKWIGTKERFPPPRHPAAPAASAPDAGAYAVRLESDPPGAVASAPVPMQAIVRHEGEGIVIGDKAGATTSRRSEPPPKGADELERALVGIEARQRTAGRAAAVDGRSPPP
jgi:penicillin-binding protein 1A